MYTAFVQGPCSTSLTDMLQTLQQPLTARLGHTHGLHALWLIRDAAVTGQGQAEILAADEC